MRRDRFCERFSVMENRLAVVVRRFALKGCLRSMPFGAVLSERGQSRNFQQLVRALLRGKTAQSRSVVITFFSTGLTDTELLRVSMQTDGDFDAPPAG